MTLEMTLAEGVRDAPSANGDQLNAAHQLNNAGDVYARGGDLDTAESSYTQGANAT